MLPRNARPIVFNGSTKILSSYLGAIRAYVFRLHVTAKSVGQIALPYAGTTTSVALAISYPADPSVARIGNTANSDNLKKKIKQT